MVGETLEEPLGMVKKMLRVEWMGQTLASTCWIVSVFVYGINSSNWLPLLHGWLPT